MKFYSTQDVCRIVGVCKATACNWAQGKVLQPGREFLWTEEDIEWFRKRNRQVGRPRKDNGG